MIKAPSPQEIEFYDNCLPTLPAQDYEIVVEQKIALRPQQEAPLPTYSRRQRVRVTGPHFGLAPEDVYSTYPPSGSQADYSTTLPHAVLTRRSLPWDIALEGPTQGPRVAPWMTVATLTPDEWIICEPSLTGTKTVSLAEYLLPPAGIVGPDFTPQEIEDLLRENPGVKVVVVDVRVEAFSAIMPALEELPFLAHVRQVNIDSQELQESVDPDGWFSVVVGNRLPEGNPDGVYVAHLVSLEGFEQYLPPRGTPLNAAAVRLLALATWSFNSRPEGDNFEQVMRNLNDGVLRLPVEELLPAPKTQPQIDVRSALDIGYAGLDYQTRLGERTVGWYRGPCLPVPMKPNPHQYEAVEAAMIYDPKTGMFDLSYAVAWQTGRMLALADGPFTTSLTRWIREQLRLLQLGGERLEWIERSGIFDLSAAASTLFKPDLMRQMTTRYLARDFAPKVAPKSSTGQGLLGSALDPSGLAALRVRIPGLLTPAELDTVLASGGHPARALVNLLRNGRQS